jgi:hypothetical protein
MDYTERSHERGLKFYDPEMALRKRYKKKQRGQAPLRTDFNLIYCAAASFGTGFSSGTDEGAFPSFASSSLGGGGTKYKIRWQESQ